MTVARHLETDSLSNQNIASAAVIGAYTADADRMIVCDVSIDQAAGNGDYIVYLTRQINGAGSAYVLLPKTTCAAASGETAIAMQSGPVTVRSGDVVTVYIDGLAGDTTTPDTVVRWFEMATLRPATADRTLTVAATGEASANVTMQAGIAVAQQPTDASIAAAVAAQFASDGIVVVTEGATAEDLYDDLAALHGANSWEGLTAQETANAALLTPVGVSAEGSQIDYLASLPADVDTELSATHGAGSWAAGVGAGSGTGVYTDTLESPSGTPVDGARVTLATDVDGENVAYEARTDAFGVFEMRPDPGTYYRFIEAAGHTFVQGVEVEVTEP